MRLGNQGTDFKLIWALKIILVFFFLVLFARLFDLQIIKKDYFKKLSENNRVKKVILEAPRGKILARGGEVLAENREIKKKLVFKNDGTIDEDTDLTGANVGEIISHYERNYPLKEAFAHVGGYLGEVSEAEVGKVNPRCNEKGHLRLGQKIGREGLEKEYDCLLTGVPGEAIFEVDIRGQVVRILGRKEPIPGKDLKTTIDFDLQKEVASLVKDGQGTVIAQDTSGQVLAFYSFPSYNPNVFIKKDEAKIKEYLTDPKLSLFNRGLGGLYHPGSVFKPIVALAGLAEGKIGEDYRYTDTGVITVNDFSYFNWYMTQYGRTEGTIDLTRALARSTDTFFYKLGELLGAETISAWAEKFGFNKKTGIDLSGEVAGLVPSPAWKKKFKKEAWFLGNTYHFAIGQGDLAVTPISLNRAIGAVAAGGKLCRPFLNRELSAVCEDLKLKTEDLNLVKKGMEKVCQEGGTGYTFFDLPNIACKTGTAETNTDGKTHAWFTLFYPADFPEMVLTVLVEGGGEGSKVAGPIARKIVDFWVHQKNFN